MAANAYNVYSYADASGTRKYAETPAIMFLGTWSSTYYYTAAPLQAVDWGSSQYICVTDNSGKNPTVAPTRWQPIRYWSPLVITTEGAGTASPDATLRIATSGSDIAVAGSNIAVEALGVATAGSNSAVEAMSIAVSGSNIAVEAMGRLSVGLSGTVSFWASLSPGAPSTIQVFVVNGVVTEIVSPP